jgi:rubrerythrin
MVINTAEELFSPTSRREFFRLAALGGTAIFLPSVFAACGDDNPTDPGVSAATLDLASDTGIVNYAFALEQLESEFYVRVVQESRAAGFNALQRRLLSDIRNHEFIHREALRSLLGTARLPELRIGRSFRDTDFRSRESILATAKALEDLGVSAYNNAGRHLTDAAGLLLVGKIVSVEARHSAIIRDMIDSMTGNTGLLFAGDDIVDENGLDNKGQPTTPTEVLAAAAPYLEAELTISNQPA